MLFLCIYDLSANQHNNSQHAVTSVIDGQIYSWELFPDSKSLVIMGYNQVMVSFEDF